MFLVFFVIPHKISAYFKLTNRPTDQAVLSPVLCHPRAIASTKSLKPSRRPVILSESEGSVYTHLLTLNFQTFRAFPSNIFLLRPKPRIPSKMPCRLVSWSVGQFYIRRAFHFTQNFYLYILVSAKPFSLFKKIKGRFPCLDSDLFSLFCSRQRII